MLKHYDDFVSFITDYGIEIEDEEPISETKVRCKAFTFGTDIRTFFAALVRIKQAIADFNAKNSDINYTVTEYKKISNSDNSLDVEFVIWNQADADKAQAEENKALAKDAKTSKSEQMYNDYKMACQSKRSRSSTTRVTHLRET